MTPPLNLSIGLIFLVMGSPKKTTASATSQPSGSTTALPPPVAAVSVKLPEWWPESAALWFSQAEAQFALKGIVDQKTKFFYVISALDNATASRIEDIISHPPAACPYDALKDRLIGCFALSDYQRLERLFSPRGLGDRRPSALMDEILSAASGLDVGRDVLKFLFLSRLPDTVRTSLIENDFSDTRAVSRRADQLWSASRPAAAVCQVDNDEQPPPSLPPVQVVFAKKPPRKQPNNSRPAPQRSSPALSQQFGLGLCYYHRVFGDEAQRCQSPCTYSTLSGNARAGRWN